MRFSKRLIASLLCVLLLLPATVLPASAASSYSNDFSNSSIQDFDTTAANALIKDGTLQLKKGEGDAAVILKTEKYENFTLEVDITVTDDNNGGAPLILYHTQQTNNPFQGGTYSCVFYPTDVKGCYFAPYADNGWVRDLRIYEGSQTFHIKMEVYDNYATFYSGDTLLGSFDSGSEHTSGYIGLGAYRAAVTFDNLKITPSAPKPTPMASKGNAVVSEDFEGALSKKWTSKTASQMSVSGGKFTLASPDLNDRYALYSHGLTDSAYMVETTFNMTGGNAGLLVKGAFNGETYEGYSFTYDKANSLLKASRYYNGYLSVVENLRVNLASGDHTLAVCVGGSKHSMYVDGELVLEFVDSTFVDGSVGYISYDGTTTFDNLKVYVEGKQNTTATTTTTTKAKTTTTTTAKKDTTTTTKEDTTTTTIADAETSTTENVETTTTEEAANTTDAADATTTTKDDAGKTTQSGTPVGGSEGEGTPDYVLPLIILAVLVVLGGGGGAAAYFVMKKKKTS